MIKNLWPGRKLLPLLTLFIVLGFHLPTRGAEKINFEDHILPILENRCLNCHNPDKAKGGLDLSSYTAMMSGGSGGEVVTPMEAQGSRLYTLSARTEEPVMPPKGEHVTPEELALLEKWIQAGILETSSSTAKKAAKPTLDLTITPAAGKPEGEPAMPQHLLLQPDVVTARGSTISDIAHSPWAPIVAVAGQKQVLLYHSEDFDLIGVLPYPEGFPRSLSFSSNGAYLSAGGGRAGKNGNVVVWDVESGERIIDVGKEFDTVLGSDVSPDLRNVILGGPGKNIKIWDTTTGEQINSIKKHPDWMLTAAYSPDGILFATGGRNGEAFVWEAGTGYEFLSLRGHEKALNSLAWRPDGNALATASEDGSIIVWDLNEGKELKKWTAHDKQGVVDISFAPDGHLASVGRDGNLRIWTIDGKRQKDIKACDDVLSSVSFSHDSKRVFVGDFSGGVTAWEWKTGKELASLESNPTTIDKQLEATQQRLKELATLLPQLEKELSKSHENQKTAAKAKSAADSALAKATKSHAAAQKRFDDLNAQFAAANKQATATKASAEAAKKAVATAAQSLARKQTEKKTAEGALPAGKTAVASASDEDRKASETLANANASLKALRENLTTQSLYEKVKATADQAKAALNAASQNVSETQKTLTVANQALKQSTEAKTKAAKRLSELAAALKDAPPEQQATLRAEWQKLQSTMPGLESKVKQQATSKQELEKTLAGQTATAKGLEPEYQKALAASKQAEQGLQKHRQAISAAENQVKAALDAQKKAKALLVAAQQKLKTQEQAIAKILHEEKSLTAALSDAQTKQSAADAEAAKHRTASGTLSTQVTAAKATLQKEQAQLTNLTKARDAAHNTLASRNKELSALRTRTKDTETERSRHDFLIKKWKAAAVNYQAHEEREELAEEAIRLDEQEEAKQKALELAEAARKAREAEQKKLADAKQTIATGKETLRVTTSSVLEDAQNLALQKAVMRLQSGTVMSAGDAKKPTDSLLAKLTQHFQLADRTVQAVEAASRVAKATPPVIEEKLSVEKTKVESLKSETTKLTQQETRVEEQKALVEKLESTYKNIVPERD